MITYTTIMQQCCCMIPNGHIRWALNIAFTLGTGARCSPIQISNSVRYGSAFSRRESPELCVTFRSLSKWRAQGKPGARCTRGLACKCTQENAHEHTGSAEA